MLKHLSIGSIQGGLREIPPTGVDIDPPAEAVELVSDYITWSPATEILLHFYGDIDVAVSPTTPVSDLPSLLTDLYAIEESGISSMVFNPAKTFSALIYLDVGGISSIENIPPTVTTLLMSGNTLDALPVLPAGLTLLSLQDSPNLEFGFDDLPDTLQYLNVRSCPLLVVSGLSHLTENLTNLSVEDCGLDSSEVDSILQQFVDAVVSSVVLSMSENYPPSSAGYDNYRSLVQNNNFTISISEDNPDIPVLSASGGLFHVNPIFNAAIASLFKDGELIAEVAYPQNGDGIGDASEPGTYFAKASNSAGYSTESNEVVIP